MKHTKGEWKVSIDRDFDIPFIKAGKLKVATFPLSWANKKYKEELQANAQLIASAPELLEACKKAEERIAGDIEYANGGIVDSDKDPLVISLRQAIAKAESK